MSPNRLQRLAIMRIAIGSYVILWTAVRTPNIINTAGQPVRRFDPVGPLWFLDSPLPMWVLVAACLIVVSVGLAMTAGLHYRITGPVTALAFMFVTTYRNSWGHVIHTENLVAMQLMVLAFAPAATVWVIRPNKAKNPSGDDGRWAVQTMAVIAVSTYFVAGVAKLRISGTAWLDGDALLHQIAFDNARKLQLGASASPLAAFFISQRWLMAPSAVAALLIELAAPLALLGRRIAMWWSASAIVLHFAILAMMAILFPYQLLGLAVLPLLPVENLVERGLRRRASATFVRWPRRSPIESTV